MNKKIKCRPSRLYLKGLNGWMTKTPLSLCLIHSFSTATSLPYTYRDCLFNWGSSRFLHASQLKHPWDPGACFSISGPWLSMLITKPLLTSLLPSGNFISGLLLCWSCLSSLLLAHTYSNSSSTLVCPSRVAKRIANTRLSILSFPSSLADSTLSSTIQHLRIMCTWMKHTWNAVWRDNTMGGFKYHGCMSAAPNRWLWQN